MLPQAALDQAINADNVAAAGAGLALSPHEVTADAVTDRARTLLANPGYAERAGRVRQEIEHMPGPTGIVPVLRELGFGS